VKVIDFAGISFRGLSKRELLEDGPEMKVIIPVNAELIVLAHENERFRAFLPTASATFDGQWPHKIASLQNRDRCIDKISGSEFVHDICDVCARDGLSVFLLGAAEASNSRAVEQLRRRYDIRVDGFSPAYSPYPFSQQREFEIQNKIREFAPNVLMVAFGAPKQEFWIDDNRAWLASCGVRWVIAVGGSIDMISGKLKRAPRILRILGVESLWRLVQEPKLRIRRFFRCFRMFRYI
jgi:N-acetylglucosaminyldiphosphoundecaprenol N-acetyl-beta-D-mannosaminyltransferase